MPPIQATSNSDSDELKDSIDIQTSAAEGPLLVEGTLSTSDHLVTLCVRLPDGRRIQHQFNCKQHRLMDVIRFAHSTTTNGDDSPLDVDSIHLSDNNVPVHVYSDYSLTLFEAGLTHNTLLHFSYY